MGFDLKDRLETTDGSRPFASVLDDKTAKTAPLAAFSVLRGAGDAFDGTSMAPDPLRAEAAVRAQFRFVDAAGEGARCAKVTSEIATLCARNPSLADRIARMKPVSVALVDEKGRLSDHGFPASMNESAAGVFWDQRAWPEARIALKIAELDRDPLLVVHEAAHAIHHLAFTKEERDLIDQVLMPVFGARAYVDEVFAIYVEAEHTIAFTSDEKRVPGIYGYVRRQWSDDHVFTRFIRKLFFPAKPLAGDKAPRARDWKKFAGG